MQSGKRFGFSAVEKNEIWSRWKAGESLHEIGRAFDKPHHEGLLPGCGFVRLLDDWIERPRR